MDSTNEGRSDSRGFGGSKPEGWGLCGGRLEFMNPQRVTVKIVIVNQEGDILLVLERYLSEKEEWAKKEEQARSKTFEECLIEMERLVALLQTKRSNIRWEEVNQLLDTAIPKSKEKFFNPQEGRDWKINPALAQNWDPNSENIKVILTAIRESLEETGLLIKPVPIVEIPRSDNHKVVICYAIEIISGRLKKESREIKETKWHKLDELPISKIEAKIAVMTQGNMNQQISRAMYSSHKHLFLPKALMALKEKNYTVPCPSEKINAFLNSQKKSLSTTPSQ